MADLFHSRNFSTIKKDFEQKQDIMQVLIQLSSNTQK
jgi:hypothetical protein